MDLVERIRSRIHDAPLPTEYLLDEAADVIEHLSGEFAIGAVVRLKSGGPGMTVFERRSNGIISAEWFVNDMLQRDAFSPAELVAA